MIINIIMSYGSSIILNNILKIATLIVLLNTTTGLTQDKDAKPNIDKTTFESVTEHIQKNFFLPLNKKQTIRLTGELVQDEKLQKKSTGVLKIEF
jgi:hypothetical protein